MYGGIPRNQWPGADNGRPDIREKATGGFDPALSARLAERKAANSPWPIDPNSSSKAEPAAGRESGERTKLTAVIPADMRKPEHRAALELLEFNLMMQFGGYTVEKARGGWLNPETGDFERESSQVYNVSFEPSETAAAKACALFVETGRALGQTWLHIERSEFFAEHRCAS